MRHCFTASCLMSGGGEGGGSGASSDWSASPVDAVSVPSVVPLADGVSCSSFVACLLPTFVSCACACVGEGSCCEEPGFAASFENWGASAEVEEEAVMSTDPVFAPGSACGKVGVDEEETAMDSLATTACCRFCSISEQWLQPYRLFPVNKSGSVYAPRQSASVVT